MIWTVELQMDGEGLSRDDFIETLMSLRFKDWEHHVKQYPDNTPEAFMTLTEHDLEQLSDVIENDTELTWTFDGVRINISKQGDDEE